MEMDIVVPDIVPVMTLPEVTFFPQALLPLKIFEPRYRRMLREVLAGDRLFAVAQLDQQKNAAGTLPEPLHRIATVGIVRACQKNEDGTSNLLLQGICRIQVVGIVAEEPYRRIRIRTLPNEPGEDAGETQRLRKEAVRLIGMKRKVGGTVSPEIVSLLRSIEDPEVFIDLAAFSLCENTALKQRLLETLDLRRRLQLFNRGLRDEIEIMLLHRKVQGPLPDEHISHN